MSNVSLTLVMTTIAGAHATGTSALPRVGRPIIGRLTYRVAAVVSKVHGRVLVLHVSSSHLITIIIPAFHMTLILTHPALTCKALHDVTWLRPDCRL
jgi:small-conductance mechanosensitive channel